jgi:hypothetical protein
MNLTKSRFIKKIHSTNKQTRKRNNNKKLLTHINSLKNKNKKQFNLQNKTLKTISK